MFRGLGVSDTMTICNRKHLVEYTHRGDGCSLSDCCSTSLSELASAPASNVPTARAANDFGPPMEAAPAMFLPMLPMPCDPIHNVSYIGSSYLATSDVKLEERRHDLGIGPRALLRRLRRLIAGVQGRGRRT